MFVNDSDGNVRNKMLVNKCPLEWNITSMFSTSPVLAIVLHLSTKKKKGNSYIKLRITYFFNSGGWAFDILELFDVGFYLKP